MCVQLCIHLVEKIKEKENKKNLYLFGTKCCYSENQGVCLFIYYRGAVLLNGWARAELRRGIGRFSGWVPREQAWFPFHGVGYFRRLGFA